MRLKHLNPSGKFPSGNARFYYRPKGQKGIAMPDLPIDHPAFLARYAELSGEAQRVVTAKPGTLARAIGEWQASRDYKARAKSTQAVWRRILRDIADKYGTAPLGGIQSKHIKADLRDLKPHVANNRAKVWRALFKWLAYEEVVPSNPTLDLTRKAAPKTDGHVPWSQSEIETFRAHWAIGTPERLALEWIYWTAARIGDAVSHTEGQISRDGWLAYEQQKTGGMVQVPIHAEPPDYAGSQDMLHRALEARQERHLIILATQTGKARSTRSAPQWFSAAARAAGLANRTAHGLRKSRAIFLRENGATTDQRAAWLGHETLSEVERYGRDADVRRIISGTKSSNSGETSSNYPEITDTKQGVAK